MARCRFMYVLWVLLLATLSTGKAFTYEIQTHRQSTSAQVGWPHAAHGSSSRAPQALQKLAPAGLP